ncbi:DNA polymerase III subunit delta [Pseudoalteromonas tunicata]|uniref:DNA polymerase III subunit delta n=1 Tax=Pseudoalteromonas tunicata D2 TaxID=87626 RepID=A4CDE4_9GAMM|nr:DNA polymerase III subunit delta [Pseudoalteromonas tunicata]ATC94092.1 DNA polymerase III subunit delta [Pseudoalteromonas tunicata]AXT29873.1 DNA polymerase III subunit delta [Pseudoalteromonas tunicata]EAR27587.1 Putative DNA polymerase III, delta subunit, probably ATP hydrolase [Pseudoalteromonas tunicata D2]MDP4983896.1 DNA polymerase III subunit delta [Pseudoalteromonas tunicata]MDP5213824.1 DNA polymerase III subunit delta [Pseudoalteromonas tunicata]
MRCYSNQLPSKLSQQLAPVYLVLGEEPFQVQQCCEQIKTAAKKQGFDELIRLSVDNQFDWQELEQHFNSLSLFSDRKIIELDLGEQKAGTSGSKTLKWLAETSNPDCILILKGAKNGTDVQKTAWFKALEAIGLFVPCYEISGNHLLTWLNQHCQTLQLNLAHDAKLFLLESTQGNLLATYQELEKLSLIYGAKLIGKHELAPVLLNQAKFDIFDLTDALLIGKSDKIVAILARLQKDNSELNSLAWAIAREAQQLLAMQQKRQQGEPYSTIFKQFNVWKNKQTITEQALSRLSLSHLEVIISQLAQWDRHLKQGTLVAPFQSLAHIALQFCFTLNLELPIFRSAS